MMNIQKNKIGHPLFHLRISFRSTKFYLGCLQTLLILALCIGSGGSLKASVLLACISLVIAPLKLQCPHKIAKLLHSLWVLVAPICILMLTQLLMNAGFFRLGIARIVLGILFVSSVTLFIYLCTKRTWAAVIVSMIIFMGMTTTNYFVVRFRGSEFAFADILAVKTALNVAGSYDYAINPSVAYALCLAILYCSIGFCFPPCSFYHTRKNILAGVIAEVVMILALVHGIPTIPTQHYSTSGTNINGYLVNFLCQIESVEVDIPDNYALAEISKLEDSYSSTNSLSSKKPDIIVVMCEAFSDLRAIGNLNTTSEITPFVDSLQENSIHGYALAPIFGGGTCNSEYEVLTGNTMAFLPKGTYPYHQYIKKDSYSVSRNLESIGYSTIATHPNIGSNWMRSTAWPLLGLEDDRYIEEYMQPKFIRNMVSDISMYEQVIAWYEHRDASRPFFLFGVTMQNHSGYDYVGEDFTSEIQLQGYSGTYPDAEQYLTLLRHSDEALEYLISYFEKVENDVVIVFFGDHLPKLDNSFYEELHGGPFATLGEQMLQYTVPFFIWANYDIESRNVGLTSLNFLSNYVYKAAGLPLPPYNAFLKDVQEVIPAMNAFGYYSNAQGAIIPYEEAEGKEAEMLEMYRILQYNSLFDEENRSEIFFPTRKDGDTE